MKIGMLSFHDSLSYGATLQCYALQRILNDMGYYAEFIDFQRMLCIDSDSAENLPSFREQIMSKMISASIRFQRIISKKNDQIVSRKFRDFKKNNISVGEPQYKSIESLKNTNSIYDAFVTGSDQVWNPFSKYLRAYGLRFVNEDKISIAYAASIGVSKIPDDKKMYLLDAIKNVKHISCREYEGAFELSKLLGRDVVNVLDPTLLICKNEWLKIAKGNTPTKPYLLCFFLGSLDYPRKVAIEIAKANNFDLYIIPQSPKDIFFRGKKVSACGPQEFLKYFLDASFICTDSFHGTAFSINFNKPFYSFCRRGYLASTSYISRISNLLEITGLKGRLIYPDSKIPVNSTSISFIEANNVIEEERRKSINFLREALRK